MTGYLDLRGIEKRFGKTSALSGIDLTVECHQLIALLGPSGCGKTTLLRIIAGFESPDAGTVTLAGRMLNGPGTFVAPERRHVGMVFQDFALFPHLSVSANVSFGMPRGTDRGKRVGELLEFVGLAGLGSRMPHELSGGQQQRVALARTFASEPELVLLDEPFSNLDPALRTRVRAEIRQMIETLGMTAIFVTHDQEEALSVAATVAVMQEGRIVQSGAPADIYRQPATRGVAEFLGEANLLEGHVRGGELSFALGLSPADSMHPEGRAHVLVRPENLEIVAEGGARGVVVRREYYGHDQMITVRLADGPDVRIRAHPGVEAAPGMAVGVVLRGEAVIVGG